ncbi:MAG TPA: hypothetical protein VIK91_25560 [Nannocystis sp.]
MLGWLLLALPFLLGGRRRTTPPRGPALPPASDAWEVLARPAIWSLGTSSTPRCNGRLAVVPAVTANWGTQIRDGVKAPLVWGWTAPGQRAVADRYAGRLVADVELKSWSGKASELAEAEYLAARCPAVTSHGFVAPSLKGALKKFAAAGRVAIPQVYDSDRSREPRAFVRQCVDSYDRAGFTRILPLLGIVAGVDYTEAWIDECQKMGVPFHLWSTGRLTGNNEPAICALV